MKKFVVFMLVALFLLGSFPMAFAEAITDESLIQDLNTVNLKNVTTLDSKRIEIPSEAIWTEVVSLPYGRGLGEVGMYQDEIGAWGPNAIVVDESGNISILDGVNSRVLNYNPTNGFRSIDIPDDVAPVTMCKAGDSYYILDMNTDSVYELRQSHQRIPQIYKLLDNVSAGFVDRLIVSAEGNVAVIDINYTSKVSTILKNKELKSQNSPLSVSIKENNAIIEDGDMSWTITLPDERCGINYIGKDKFGNAYVKVSQYAPNSAVVAFESTIRKYAKDGSLIGVTLVPTDRWIFCADRYAYVTEEGKLYIIGFGNSNATIYEVTLGAEYSSSMDEVIRKAEALEQETKGVTTKGITVDITRSAVRANAINMTFTSWTLQAGKKLYLPVMLP